MEARVVLPSSPEVARPPTNPTDVWLSRPQLQGTVADDGPPARVLLVADDGARRLAGMLERAGFEVIGCPIDRATTRLRQLDHSLVVATDAALDVLDEIRSDPGFDTLPFLIVSGSHDPDHIADILDRGASDFLEEDADEQELIARIVATLKRTRTLHSLEDALVVDAVTFEYQLERELIRAGRGEKGAVAILEVPGLDDADDSTSERRQMLAWFAEYLATATDRLDLIGITRYGELAILLARTNPDQAAARLGRMAAAVNGLEMECAGGLIDMTPRIGYVSFGPDSRMNPAMAVTRAAVAAAEATAANATEPRRFSSTAPPSIPADQPADVPLWSEDSSERVLIVEDDRIVATLLKAAFESVGMEAVTADGSTVVRALGWSRYDVIIADRSMPVMSGDELLRRVRSDPNFDLTPVLFLTASGAVGEIVAALEAGADDYLVKPFLVPEVIARIRARVAAARLSRRQADHTLVPSERFEFELSRELDRAAEGGPAGSVAIVEVPTLDDVAEHLGPRMRRTVLEELATAMQTEAGDLDVFGATRSGDLAVLLPTTSPRDAGERLTKMAESVAGLISIVGGMKIRPVPMIGYYTFESGEDIEPDSAIIRSTIAATQASSTQDLQPRLYRPAQEIEPKSTTDHHLVRELLQIAVTSLMGTVAPFFVYMLLDAHGHDITGFMYIAVVVALVVTGALIWTEGILSGRHLGPPEETDQPAPPASAIICAYLPNEAATIVETVEAFLRVDYEPGLQIILAYNTPRPLPVEDELRHLARLHSNLVVLRVPHSNSKAQNLNYALARTEGDFVGVFDADHHPQPGSFQRAWRWLSNGYDAVQGHCLVRNGDDSFVARMVAVEFESIYAVSHPGRWLRDQFGIFGGSNGYWKTDQLHRIRMRGSMLTEDIDSSMRLLDRGGRIASDPGLVSREIATTTVRQVWNQRLRWAQGWFQVSMRHVFGMLTNSDFTLRQKFGIFNLLLQREVYPWISLQMFPLVAYWFWRGDGFDWFVPIFVATTIFTTSVGPGQVIFAYRRAHPDIKQHRWWFVQYFFFSIFVYTEAKNIIARVAQLKQAMGESSWRVTPRSVHPAG